MKFQKKFKRKSNDVKQSNFRPEFSKSKTRKLDLHKEITNRKSKNRHNKNRTCLKTLMDDKLYGEVKNKRRVEVRKQELSVTENNEINELPRLSLKDNFDWNVKLEQFCVNTVVEESEEEYENSLKQKKKMTRSEKIAAAKEAESKLRQIEYDLLRGEQNPQSADQFDRVLLAHPENAALWIKYMSFYLQATEIDKARAIAKRALLTINHHNEGERFNIWVALLNLENAYGTEESLKDAFNEALRTNDEYMVYSKMLEIYAGGNKPYETELIAKTMIKKFRCSYDCWLLICKILMKYNMVEKARSFFLKAGQNLTRKECVNLTSQFAKLEKDCGFAEEGHKLYENILTIFPERIDLWIVYVDMLVKENRIEQAREVMERAVKHNFSVKKMKSLYTKWLSLEEKHGNEDAIEHVKKAAVQYINKMTNSVAV